MTEDKKLRDSVNKWEREIAQPSLKKRKERLSTFKTDSGLTVKPLYTPLDLKEISFDYLRDLGFPGQFPFTRGKDPLGYRQNFWIMAQYAGFGDAEETNKRFRFLLDSGVTGLSVPLDLPTQLGYDSDHPMAEGERGKVGVAIDSLQDMEVLFGGIPLDRPRNISTTANAIGPIWLALMIVLAKKQGVSPEKVLIRIQNDILKEFVARGAYIFPPEPSVSIATDAITYCAEHFPNWLPLTPSGYHMRDAGADTAQEIAFTIANTITYIDNAVSKGVNPEKFVSSLSVLVSSGMDFFEEIAKFRALRRLWARTLQRRYRVSKPDLLSFFEINYTKGSSLTAQQPINNAVRVAFESLAAVLGGCQTCYSSSYDEAYCTPTEQTVKVALRTQQIIAHETGVANTIDPLAGSYYVEYLTSQLERKAEEYMKEVEALGGSIKAIEEGYFQRAIAKSAYEYQQQVENGERVIVGVNQYVEPDETPIELTRVDPAMEKRQKEKLKAMKRARDNAEVRRALRAVKSTAKKGENLVPSLIEAVKAYATIGEMCDALREVHGEYTAAAYY